MVKKNVKKEFAINLPPVAYRRVSKREVSTIFYKEWKTVYEAMIKDQYKIVPIQGTKRTEQKGIKNTKERLKWFWPRFYNLIAAKYRIDLLPANDDLYFLARRITAPEIAKNPSKWAERLELMKSFLKSEKCIVNSY
jgi:hypothetical protein